MSKFSKGKLGSLKFQFNPSKMTYDGGVIWTDISSAGNYPMPVASSMKAKTFSFELWINKKAFRKVDMAEQFVTLMKYRDSKEAVWFAFGSFVCKVIVKECPFDLEAWDNRLSITEMKVPITLQIV